MEAADFDAEFDSSACRVRRVRGHAHEQWRSELDATALPPQWRAPALPEVLRPFGWFVRPCRHATPAASDIGRRANLVAAAGPERARDGAVLVVRRLRPRLDARQHRPQHDRDKAL